MTTPLPDARDGAEEQLRRLGLQFTAMIRRRPGDFERSAEWLRDLPVEPEPRRDGSDALRTAEASAPEVDAHLPIAPTSTGVGGDPLRDREDRVRRAKTCRGPILQRLNTAWRELARVLPEPGQTTDRYAALDREEAERLALLIALCFVKEFDGSEVGVGYPWDPPTDEDPTASFEGRVWASDLAATVHLSADAIVEAATKSLEYLTVLPRLASGPGVERPTSGFRRSGQDVVLAACEDEAESRRTRLPKLAKHDLQAWQLAMLHGRTQVKVADTLNKEHGTQYTQGQVSRMIGRAKAHADANGLSEMVGNRKAAPPRVVDPGRLDLGARTDKRRPRPSDAAEAEDGE